MKELTDKQLKNLEVDQLDEIRRELGHCISALSYQMSQSNSESDYTRKRTYEKYLTRVKAVYQHKVNTGQK
ncbi:hypothetical protein [Erwinia phage FBB1]|nr:hypothetical protein [Erwinia phage FBB1]